MSLPLLAMPLSTLSTDPTRLQDVPQLLLGSSTKSSQPAWQSPSISTRFDGIFFFFPTLPSTACPQVQSSGEVFLILKLILEIKSHFLNL